MKHPTLRLCSLWLCLVVPGGTGAAKLQKATPQAPAAAQQDDLRALGQQVFEHNCSRCHNSPDGLPVHVSRTVAMHMRVRALLSEPEYKALLQFLNP